MQKPSPVAVGIHDSLRLSSIPQPEPVFWRLGDVIAYLNLSRSSIYRLLDKDPDFPKPVRLVGRVLAWRVGEVQAWADSRERVEQVVT